MKMKGRHTSVDKHVKHSLTWLEKQQGVQKVVLGISESCRHRYPPGFIRFKKDVEGGIKVNSYSGNGVTDIFIKIDPIAERENIKAKMIHRFENQNTK